MSPGCHMVFILDTNDLIQCSTTWKKIALGSVIKRFSILICVVPIRFHHNVHMNEQVGAEVTPQTSIEMCPETSTYLRQTLATL
jgi:hypothetical protein